MLVCDKCEAGITEGAKFCAQCGDPVTEADRRSKPATEHSVAMVRIAFGVSSSANYTRAVSICEKLPGYEVEVDDDGKTIRHSILMPITEVELLVNVFDLVGSWKSSQMLINGHAASKKDLTYYGVGCYRNRQKAYRPEQYCFGENDYEANFWGCKRLNMPISEYGGGWLDFGEFDKSGVWHFDKNRIRHDLEVSMKEDELCPVLVRGRILETLDRLPAAVNPKKDRNWKYRTSYQEVGGDFKQVAVGILPVLRKANRFVIGDYRPTWEFEDDDDRSLSAEVAQLPSDLDPVIATERTGIRPSVWVLFGVLVLFLFLLLK